MHFPLNIEEFPLTQFNRIQAWWISSLSILHETSFLFTKCFGLTIESFVCLNIFDGFFSNFQWEVTNLFSSFLTKGFLFLLCMDWKCLQQFCVGSEVQGGFLQILQSLSYHAMLMLRLPKWYLVSLPGSYTVLYDISYLWGVKCTVWQHQIISSSLSGGGHQHNFILIV